MASIPSKQPTQPPTRKPRFASAARNFANRVAGLPGLPMLLAGGAAAIVLTTITGAFGTIDMPFGRRLAFWAVLIGWNVTKWTAWFAWLVRRRADWARAGAIGALVVNLPLALEIPAALWLFGLPVEFNPARVWVEAAAISATLFVLFRVARPRAQPVAAAVDHGILTRAGVRDPGTLRAITAEDHYCRLHLAGGGSALVLARFADVLAEVGDEDGERVHRGAWVATAAVDGTLREGRAWRLVAGELRLPVSASYLPTVRARGWLRIKPPVGVA